MSKRRFPMKKHGGSYLPEYRAWQTMRLRCTVPENPAFPGYGGRGITVFAAWLEDFPSFLAHVGRKPSPRHELDRIDNDRGYEPGNVRWVLRWQNDRNRRSNRWVTYRGERRLLRELCEERGTWPDVVRYRLRHGMSLEEALEKPVRPKKSARGRSVPPVVATSEALCAALVTEAP